MNFEQELRSAVRAERPLLIKYYPNKDGQQRVGWRNILPLSVYTRKGIKYCLAWFTDGASVSNGTGYRLYFVRNVNDLKFQDTTSGSTFIFAMITRTTDKDIMEIKAQTKGKNFNYTSEMMILRGQVE